MDLPITSQGRFSSAGSPWRWRVGDHLRNFLIWNSLFLEVPGMAYNGWRISEVCGAKRRKFGSSEPIVSEPHTRLLSEYDSTEPTKLARVVDGGHLIDIYPMIVDAKYLFLLQPYIHILMLFVSNFGMFFVRLQNQITFSNIYNPH